MYIFIIYIFILSLWTVLYIWQFFYKQLLSNKFSNISTWNISLYCIRLWCEVFGCTSKVFLTKGSVVLSKKFFSLSLQCCQPGFYGLLPCLPHHKRLIPPELWLEYFLFSLLLVMVFYNNNKVTNTVGDCLSAGIFGGSNGWCRDD